MAVLEVPLPNSECSCGSPFVHRARNVGNRVIHSQADLEQYARDFPNRRGTSGLTFNSEIERARRASIPRP